MAKDEKIGPVFCEGEMTQLDLGWWPAGSGKPEPPLRRRLTWYQASRMVAGDSLTRVKAGAV